MSEYTNSFDDLRGDILGVLESMRDMHTATSKMSDALAVEIDRLWKDNAELRDDLHALANRVETLTRARLTEPAETTEAMVSPSRWHECECGRTVRRSASDGLIYDDGGLHTCQLDAANVRRMAKEYE